MRAADTNIVVRYLVADDDAQFERASRFLENAPCWLGITVLLETEWVLRRAYRRTPTDIAAGLKLLYGLPMLTVERARDVASALDWFEQGMDFADALHLATTQDCDGMVTFDRDFIKTAARIGAGNVAEP